MVIEYSVALILSSIISGLVAVIAWRRRSAPGATGLALAMFGMVIWASTYAIRWLQIEPSLQMRWLDLTYIGVVIAPTSFLIFTLQFTNRSYLLNYKTLILLTFEPLITLGLLFTDQFHGLFYAGHRTTGSILNGGIGFWIHIVYTYGVLLIALGLLIQMYYSSHNVFRKQTSVMVLGMLIPWIGNILGLIKLSPFPQLDLTPFMFTASGLIISFGLFRYHLMDIIPVARDRLVENMSDGVLVLDAQKRIVDINPAAWEILRFSKNPIGAVVDSILPFWTTIEKLSQINHESQIEYEMGDQSAQFLEVRFSTLVDRIDNVYGYLLIVRDISDRKQSEINLKKSEEKYRLLFENATEMIVVIQDMRVIFCNPMTIEVTGYSESELKEFPFIKFVFPADLELVKMNHAKRLKGESIESSYEFRLVTKNGQIKWAEVSGITIEWNGRPATLNFLSDITIRKETEEALKYQSNHDILTGLYNRQYFESEMERLQFSRRFPVSIIMIDVDGLKKINDQYGHQAGDGLLRNAAQVIRQTFRPDDMVARIGGDEFVVILADVDEISAKKSIERLRQNLNTYNQKGRNPYQLDLSIGTATGEIFHDLLTILKHADEAMYDEKKFKNSFR